MEREWGTHRHAALDVEERPVVGKNLEHPASATVTRMSKLHHKSSQTKALSFAPSLARPGTFLQYLHRQSTSFMPCRPSARTRKALAPQNDPHHSTATISLEEKIIILSCASTIRAKAQGPATSHLRFDLKADAILGAYVKAWFPA